MPVPVIIAAAGKLIAMAIGSMVLEEGAKKAFTHYKNKKLTPSKKK